MELKVTTWPFKISISIISLNMLTIWIYKKGLDTICAICVEQHIPLAWFYMQRILYNTMATKEPLWACRVYQRTLSWFKRTPCRQKIPRFRKRTLRVTCARPRTLISKSVQLGSTGLIQLVFDVNMNKQKTYIRYALRTKINIRHWYDIYRRFASYPTQVSCKNKYCKYCR